MLPPGDTPEERAKRQVAYERLLSAAQRAGVSLDRLHKGLQQVARNEAETRRFLAREVYGVSDDLLDDLVRVKLEGLSAGEAGEE